MKTKTFTSRLFSILLCLCMVLSILPATSMTAFAATMTGGEVLYLQPNSNWSSADARFAAYFYGSGDAWASLTPVESDPGIYKVTVPSGSWTNVIFCRMNPATTANTWDNKWNQTGDLVYDGTNNLCKINSGLWDCGVNVSWTAFTETEVEEPACTHETHSQDGKCTACGEPVEHTYVDRVCACGAIDPTEPVSVTVYCINSAKWTDVRAYAWTDGGAGLTWPGIEMTKTEETVNGFDVYEITFDVAYENVVFNDTAGSQTADLEFKDGQYYDVKAGTWYESLDAVPAIDPLVTDRFLVGSFNGWSTSENEFKRVEEGAGIGYVTLELEAETTYEFKIVSEGSWTSCATAITGTVSDLVFSNDVSDNVTITTTAAGTYVFAFDLNGSVLSVTYPEVEEPECTHETHGQDGKCTVCGEPVEHTYVDGVCACGAKNGIMEEDGSLFYYVDGSRYYAGLIEIDGDIYYVRTNGELVHGQSYWPTKTNGLKPVAKYDFDESGKLIVKNGLVEENGGLYYYVDSQLNYAGLIEIDGAWYYIRSNGQAVTGTTYWITKTNGLKTAANYIFDAEGKMVLEGTFVKEADGTYYYVNGNRNYAGLLLVNGDYYYVRSNGQLVTGKTYMVSKTNDLLPAAYYSFDANGIMENPPA